MHSCHHIKSLNYLVPVLCVALSITLAKADAPTKQAPVVAIKYVVQAKDSSPISRLETQPQFEVLGISEDGKTLFLRVQRINPQVSYSLQAIDLGTGQTSIICEFNRVGSFGWYPQSASIKSNTITSQLAVNATNSNPQYPTLRLEAPVKNSSISDTFRLTTPQLWDGKVVYSASVSAKEPIPHWESFLVVRKLKVPEAVTTYPTQSNSEVGFPEFSPDGKEVLLKVGLFGDRYNQHHLYLWQPEGGKLRLGPKEPTSYLLTRWSPDSRFLAYVTGIDAGGEPSGNQPMRLQTYDLKTNKSRTVAQNINTDFAWSSQNRIFYSKWSKQTSLSDIYEIPSNGGAPKLTIKAGYSPKPSPDSQWIAFLGQPNRQNTPMKLGKPGLYLFNIRQGTRTLIKADISKTTFFWTQDSKQLVVMETQYDTVNSLGEAKLSVVSLADKPAN